MPVKKVPGGYMIVPRRVGPGGRDKPGAWAKREEDVETLEDGSGDTYETAMSEGGPGGDGAFAPPVDGETNGAGVDTPQAQGLPGGGVTPGHLAHGTPEVTHHGPLADYKMKAEEEVKVEDGSVEAASPARLAPTKAKVVARGKAGGTTQRARSRPPSRPPPGRRP